MEPPGSLMDKRMYSNSFKDELENLFTLKVFSKGDHLFRQKLED